VRWVRSVLPPVVVGIVGLALWELVVRAGRIAPFILPAPSAIGEQLWLDRAVVWEAGLASGANALVGLVLGSALALAAALLSFAACFPRATVPDDDRRKAEMELGGQRRYLVLGPRDVPLDLLPLVTPQGGLEAGLGGRVPAETEDFTAVRHAVHPHIRLVPSPTDTHRLAGVCV